jgi:hypothetical protein
VSPADPPAPSIAASPSANGTILDAASGRPVAHVTTDGAITGAAPDGRGGWFIAGAFLAVNGESRAHLAHIGADGSIDRDWVPPVLGPERRVGFFLGIARAGNRVVVAGGFRRAGAFHAPGLAVLDAESGALDTSWHAPTTCYDGYRRVRGARGLVVAATACAAPPCLIGIRPSDGHQLWAGRIAAIGEVGCAQDVVALGGDVAFTGGFTAVDHRPRHGVAAVRAGDGRATRFHPRGACTGVEHTIAGAPPLLFVGGDGCPIAAFDLRTSVRRWAIPRRGNATTSALASFRGRVYVGGELRRLAGKRVNGLAVLDAATGTPIPSWHPSYPTSVELLSLSSGRLLIGG